MAAPATYRRRARLDTAIARGNTARSGRFDQGGHLAAEIALRPVDAFPERIAHEPGHLDRAADLALGFLDRLRHALVRLVNERLIEQADLLVEGLEPRFDDLVDHIRRLSLRLVFVREHLFFAPDHIGIETGRIDRLRVGGGDMHRDHAAEALELVALAGRLHCDEHPDLAETF